MNAAFREYLLQRSANPLRHESVNRSRDLKSDTQYLAPSAMVAFFLPVLFPCAKILP